MEAVGKPASASEPAPERRHRATELAWWMVTAGFDAKEGALSCGVVRRRLPTCQIEVWLRGRGRERMGTLVIQGVGLGWGTKPGWGLDTDEN